jgi:hypothetical protein
MRYLRKQLIVPTLLLLVASVGLFLGYAHWRRVSILRESKELSARGVRFLWAEGSRDGFWPVIPKQAAFEYDESSSDEVEIAGVTYSLDEAKLHTSATLERLNRLGVAEVVIVKNGKRTTTWVSTRSTR